MNKPVILIVEDDRNNQRLIEVLVRKNGWDSKSVSTGHEAYEQITGDTRYSAILMDWRLPDTTGLDCARKIREFENPIQRHTPIIAVTANAMENHQTECLNAGMDAYISKPFVGAELLDMVQRWVDQAANVQPSAMARVN